MSKVIIVQLGGEDRILDFTRNGFYEHLEDFVGMDAMEWMKKFSPGEGAFKQSIKAELTDMAAFVYAGHNSWLDTQNKPAVDPQIVRRWVRAIETDKYASIAKAVFSLGGGENDSAGENPAPGDQ